MQSSFIRKILILLFFIVSITSFSQDSWEFSNSTPQEAVRSHLYFLDRTHYDPELATYTLSGTKPSSEKIVLAKKLKDILLKHRINVDKIINKRRGVIHRNKYVLFADLPKIYLVRDNRKWKYSEETVNSINSIYNSYYLKLNEDNSLQSDLDEFIKKKTNSKKGTVVSPDSTNINDENVVDGLTVDLSTPYNTILSHLIFLDDSLFSPDLSAQTINFSDEDTIYREELAIKLKQIFLGSRKHVFDISKISTDSNYIDTLSNKHIYFPNPNLPELYLEKIGDKWMYSNSTSKLINSVHLDMYSEDAEQIFSFSDKFKRWAGVESGPIFYNIRLWQIYMVLYFSFMGLLLYLASVFIIRTIIFRILAQSRYKKITFKIIQVFAFIIYWYIVDAFIPALMLNMELTNILHKTINVTLVFNHTLISIYIVNFLRLRFTKEGTSASTQGLVIFMSLIVKTIIFITSLLFFIRALDFNVVNVLAGLSIGGFAIALGAQDTIKNFFGSLMIFADKQFSVGDWITSDKVSGTVEEVGLRTTKIRTFHNSVVVVPNSQLADNSIDNMGRRTYRRYNGKFVIKFDTPTEKIEEFTTKIKEEILKRDDTRKDFYMVYINDFETYGLGILVYVFFKVPDWESEMKGKHELITKILDFADQLKIEFAIPPR